MGDHVQRRQRFDSLFEAYKVDIASYCGWRTGSRADAEEAVAEVFLVAWRKLDLVPEGDAARAWLYGTARKVTANTRRSGRRRDALVERVSQQLPIEEDRGVSTEDAIVHEALAMLSEKDREVLLLVEWEGLRPGELGDVLGCQEVTARGRLHRARARFRETFESVMKQEAVRLTGETRKAQP
jgi:RNA polymerase sigma-70 factor (ECF subfamily)